jgi:hypothetical protein
VNEAPDGDGVTESFTVLHDRDGPERALVTALLADGSRALAVSHDSGTMSAMLTEEFVGRPVRLRSDGQAHYS